MRVITSPSIFMKIYIQLLLLFFVNANYCQQETKILVALDPISGVLNVVQTIQFTNQSSKPLDTIVLNDWNNAYSEKFSPLGIRFSDEFVRRFHMATDGERGKTTISSLKINDTEIEWNRVKNQVDLIEIPLSKQLNKDQTIVLEIKYVLKIPDVMFTKFGKTKQDYYLKNIFLSVARINELGEFTKYSNENLEDIANENLKQIEADFVVPNDYQLTTNLNIVSQNKEENYTIVKTVSSNINQIQLAIEKQTTYENFKNSKMDVQTNLIDSKLNGIQKALIVDKVVNYVANNLGEISQKKLMVSQVDYDRNPFYGLNQLPSFLSPFPNDFLYELKFLKSYLYNYLNATLKIDARKDAYVFDAIQTFMMMNYIQENYPDLKMLGNISKFKILKSYNLTKSDFNDQYYYLFLLMARKNLDQGLSETKEDLIKFNEQIASKYKAGLIFRYLNTYLQNSIVNQSFKEFVQYNQLQKTTANQLENTIKQKTNQNLDWFFDNLVRSRKTVDYTFGKVLKGKDSISFSIKNNTEVAVPIDLYGFKNNQIVFKKWISNIKKDTILSIENGVVDKLVLNYNNEVPEFNQRNNSKSLKGFFSFNRPIKFTFFKDLEDSKYNQVFYVPEIGFNLYDGAILSMNFNNKSFLEKPFVYDLKPSYSTNTSSITGSGGFSFNHFNRDSKLYSTRYSLSAVYLHYDQDAAYLRVTPNLSFRFREKEFRNNKREYLNFRYIFVDKEEVPFNPKSVNVPDDSPLKYGVFESKYVFQNVELAKALVYATGVQFSKDFGKITGEFTYRKLFESNYQIGLRMYAGSFLYRNTNSEFFSFGLDRPKDYLFDYNFYGRSEKTGFYSQQYILAEGGFKSKFENPYANKWMTTMNVTSSIWHWIQMYGDVGLYQNKGKKSQFVYDSGVHLNLVPDYFEVFLPVYSSNGLEIGQKNYSQKIRFMFTISPKTLINLFTRKWF